jgi:predicted nucleic acid-binding protein
VYPDRARYADALDLEDRYRVSFYGALVLAGAPRAGCNVLYSEDLQDGGPYVRALRVRNPFAAGR